MLPPPKWPNIIDVSADSCADIIDADSVDIYADTFDICADFSTDSSTDFIDVSTDSNADSVDIYADIVDICADTSA